MQGKRSAIGSIPDSINFDFESTSTNMGIDPQTCCNTLRDPAESRLPEYQTTPDGTDLSRWNTGEPSSRNLQSVIFHDERISQNGWSSSLTISSAGAGPRLENQVYNNPNGFISSVNLNLNGNPIASSGSPSQNLDINVGQLERRLIPSSNGSSEAFAASPGSGGFLVEEEDDRNDYSFDGRRFSCKRKSIEGNAGQSSSSGSLSGPDSVNPRLRLSIGGVSPPNSVYVPTPNVGVAAAPSRRNYRVRMNPTSDQDNSVLPRVGLGHSEAPSGHRPLRFVPVNPPLVQPENAAGPQGQSVVLRLPALRRNAQSIRSSDAPLLEDLNSSPVPRNISEHPMFMPSVEVRSSSVLPVWNSDGVGGIGTSTHIASSSRVGPGSVSQFSSGPTWGSHRHASSSSAQDSRRLSEYVRRSLLSSAGSDVGLHHHGSSSASSSQEAVLPSAGGLRRPNPLSSRSALLMDRHGDGVVGRSRLVSEHIRNVLDSMRRGEGLRFEDVMILDPSVFFGMADIHDEHRDMRLDVDNMSYEELLALEERIGNVSTGLSEEKILARLKQTEYLAIVREDQAEAEPCCICQEEYKDGEGLGTLDCGHDFHTRCVKQWLSQKNSCPICKTTGLAA